MKPVPLPDPVAEALLALMRRWYSGPVTLHLNEGRVLRETHTEETKA